MSKKALLALFLVISVTSCLAFQEQSKPQTQRESILVTPTWLAGHLNDPKLVILHVATTRRDYMNGHIPGARFLWVGTMAASTPELSFELTPLEQLDTTVESLGINNDSRIILYFTGASVASTARMFVTLEYLGLGDRTSILDGGLDAWKNDGRQVTTEAPKIVRGKFSPNVHPNVFVDAQYVNANLNSGSTAILDARLPNFYAGNGGGMPRPGHIPNAKNLPYTSVFDSTNRIKNPEVLRQLFQGAGVTPGEHVVTYCHVGQTASVVYLAARVLGYDVSLYDGSFEDWSGRLDLPIVVPEKK